MFSYQLYNLLHVLGIMLVFMALGALAFHGANGGTKDSNKVRGLVMGTHGLGVLLIIVAGFGMLARTRSMAAGLPGWLHPKLLIWVLLGAAPAILNRKPEWGKLLWFLLPLLAATSAYFGINHPGESSAPAVQDDAETKTE
ncbi:hypothetical protein ENSA5_09650 [Enhygromyxa salina]|uniref:Uncharacterized protein n=1 Tax=Enhygromyxa salina TaxID=215803 RepID=A0A2S9YGJ4_9BACT|nr:hypothetical protein [Enhygromyxa salina]PRQ04228.1 hypothetical protein ENSA5_09650 [Enhygromyxa salina]